MVSGQKRYAVGTFSNSKDVKHVLDELNQSGFPVEQISIVAKYGDCDRQLDRSGMSDGAGDEDLAEAATGTITGSMVGAVLGCLTGIAILTVPGVGFMVAAGTTGTALVTTLAGAGIGAIGGSLIQALTGLKIPSDPARVDSDRCWPDEYILMVNGPEDELPRAESILIRSCSSKVWLC